MNRAQNRVTDDEEPMPIALLAHEPIESEEQRSVPTKELSQTLAGMHEFAGHLLMAQENERQRLASELHDDFAQRTTLIELLIRRLEEALGKEAINHREALEALSKQVCELACGLSDASRRLHPSVLEHLGLSAAIQMLVEEQQAQNQEVIFVESGSGCRLAAWRATAIYRIAEEALRNAAQHAPAAPVRIVLIFDESSVELAVEDAGEGFDLEAVQLTGKSGLLSMEERARSIGGRFTIVSAMGQGTKIRVQAPTSSDVGQE